MKVRLKNIGKRYNQEWIFRGLEKEFNVGQHCVLLGSNGSGKSTLLQVINGNYSPSEGEVDYELHGAAIENENAFKHISLATPYMELIEEFTLTETLDFHAKFKPFINDLKSNEIIELLSLQASREKELKYFSSGMRQRVKLALAILSDVPMVLLDEPTSNLDRAGVEWYRNLVQEYSENRLFIVASNQQKDEYFFCEEALQVEDYK